MLNKKALPDVDMCYFWASHGSHSQQEVLQSIYGKDKVVLCKGGVQTIVDNIAKDFHIIM